MRTVLFHETVFGPIHSRRLGSSLGVNLSPRDGKVCSFDCLYCEAGFNAQGTGSTGLPSRSEVSALLRARLESMRAAGEPLDVITFSGNGEPTLHPDFELIIDDTLALRDELCPSAKVSVLSNATQIGREDVRRALLRVDNNILKLDSAFDATVEIMDKPQGGYTVRRTVELLKLFEGRLIIQTMFLRGEYLGQKIDNTSPEEVEAWLRLIDEIRPRQVMVYSLDRDTPCRTIERIDVAQLRSIAARVEQLGIAVSVA